ncbi:hypothetical protein P8452_29521 [Trifolium repens]|nr:metacaspase-1 [Trifolium repens]WJX42270.1 hypothetical protein P8452_29520 [Trifolium repens]WJX42271.1 hypothetical protein P8452_29521 [Trifolium repens]
MNRIVDAVAVFSIPRTKRALLIGMSHVGDTSANYVPCYLHDVCSIKKLLEERYVFRTNNISIMYDNWNLGTERPTARNVYKALFDLVLKTRFGDVLLFYFTGHGGRFLVGIDSNNSNFLEYICLADNSYLSGSVNINLYCFEYF